MTAMNEDVAGALARERTIDITTIGRRSGKPSRIETWFHRVGGEFYLTGSPGRRDWYANLLEHPDFTFHLKGSVRADLPARATPITDEAERRSIMGQILRALDQPENLEAWVAGSPLARVEFEANQGGD